MRQGTTLALYFALWAAFTASPALAYSLAPALPTGSRALNKAALSISFNPAHHEADWVFYDLGPDHLQNCVQRADSFRPDPELPLAVGGSLADYRGSGFDRGHLSPAGDNKWSREAMHESFLLSNISPQPSAFNRGIWAKLENLVRAWASQGGGLWVATGPVLKDGLEKIGATKISVPESFYKVLITKDERHAIALELPSDARGDISQYAVPVRSLEETSSLHFFASLEDRDDLKNDLDLRPWDFDARFQYEECRTAGERYAPAAPTGLLWFYPG